MAKPKYRFVFRRAVRETVRIVLARSWSELVWNLLATAAVVAMAFAFIQITPADDVQLFTDKVATLLIAVAAAAVLVFGVFLAQLLFIAPFQLWKAEWARAEDAERRCGELSGGGPIRDRTGVLEAAAYMIFGDWNHSVDELTDPVEQITTVADKMKLLVQDASDGRLDIWVKRQRHGGIHVNPGQEYWGDHHIDYGSLDGRTLMAKANAHVSQLTETFDPVVRKSDIERLYG